MTPTEKRKDSYLKRTYGVSLEDFKEMLLSQGGKCPICLRSFDTEGITPCLDHSHSSGEVRKILCRYCNHRIVGRHKDPEILRRVADYLEGPHTGIFIPKKKKRKSRGKKIRIRKTP